MPGQALRTKPSRPGSAIIDVLLVAVLGAVFSFMKMAFRIDRSTQVPATVLLTLEGQHANDFTWIVKGLAFLVGNCVDFLCAVR